jgi:hypothetical protein
MAEGARQPLTRGRGTRRVATGQGRRPSPHASNEGPIHRR